MPAPALILVSRAEQTLGFTLRNNDGVTRNFRIEVNRAADFSSDDTLFQVVGSGAGDVPLEIYGLPSTTPWYVRAINLADGTVSGAVLAATLPVAAAGTYTGFSIDKAMLVVPTGIADLKYGYGVQQAGYPIANLLVDSPAATFRNGPGDFRIDFMTSGEPIDTIALLGTMFSDSAEWYIRAFADEARTARITEMPRQLFRCSPTLGRRRSYHGLFQFPSPVAARVWSIDVYHAGPQAIMRHLVAGLARQSVNASRGWSHGLNDLGTAGLTRFGDPDIVPGWRGKTVDFEMSWLTEREYQTKWADLPQLVGRTKPVLVIPNSKRNVWLNDRIGYGTITDYRAENVQSSRHSVSIAVNSIY